MHFVHLIVLSATSLALLLAANVPTAVAGGVPRLIKWADVEKLIVEHPSLRIARERVRVAEGDLGITRQYSNPELGIRMGKASEYGGPVSKFVWDLELTIPVEWPGKYIYRSRAADEGIKAAVLDLGAERLAVYRDIRALYEAIGYDQETRRTLSGSEEQLARLTAMVRVRVAKGDARPADLARIEAELEELQIEVSRNESEARTRRARLSLWLGDGLPTDYSVEPVLERIPSESELAALLDRSPDDHPAVRAAVARKKQAAASVSAEKHAAAPDLSAGAYYGEDFDSHGFGGLLSLSLPLWNWNLGGISRARAEENAADSQVDLARRRVKEAVIEMAAKARGAFDAVCRYRSEILPRAQRALDDTEALYKAGEIGLTEVLDAKRALLRMQGGYNAVRFELLNAMLDLNVLTGGAGNV
jgi:cobalt-zinc-cadmium efflux system outer membrane protein